MPFIASSCAGSCFTFALFMPDLPVLGSVKTPISTYKPIAAACYLSHDTVDADAMKNPAWKELLRQLRVFETVRDDKKFDKLLDEGASTERVVAQDEMIVRKGWIGDSLFLIGSGAVEVLLESADGDPILLAVLGRGEIFGEMSFFERGKRVERSATARAKEPSTILEIHASGLQEVLDEHPDIEFKLLLMLTDRLRHANSQILGLQRSTVDDKLKLMNARLDAEHMVYDAQLTAAGKVFDQTKLRVDEIINSAERSRDRLNKSALLMGTFVTIVTGLLGLFGWSKVADIDRARVAIESSAKKADGLKIETEGFRNAAATLAEKAADSHKKAEELLGMVRDLRGGLVEIYRARFFEALEKGSAMDANQAYGQIKAAGAVAEELPTLLSEMESKVVARARPPAPGNAQELSGIRTFGALLQRAVVDADAGRPREKLDSYYLLLAYALLTDQRDFEQMDGEFKDLATRQGADAALQKYVSSRTGAPPRAASEELVNRLSRESGKRADDLQDLARLAKVSRSQR